jgi:hypothetical protein
MYILINGFLYVYMLLSCLFVPLITTTMFIRAISSETMILYPNFDVRQTFYIS